jgi:transcription initiation factor TFIID TATA-box-binding protein
MSDESYESLKIVNIVASGVIADSIDLVELSNKVEGCELNTKRFPGAVYRIQEPKIASLIFSSGKIVLTGSRSSEALTEGLAMVIKSLKDAGIDTIKEPKVAITNMVCSYDLGIKINLNRVAVTFNVENIEYRIKDPKMVALIFSSGKIILAGGKNLVDIRKAVDILKHKLESIR